MKERLSYTSLSCSIHQYLIEARTFKKRLLPFHIIAFRTVSSWLCLCISEKLARFKTSRRIESDNRRTSTVKPRFSFALLEALLCVWCLDGHEIKIILKIKTKSRIKRICIFFSSAIDPGHIFSCLVALLINYKVTSNKIKNRSRK